jgi:hypothetical protein
MTEGQWETNEDTGVQARVTYRPEGDEWTAEVTGGPFGQALVSAPFGIRNGHKARAIRYAQAHLDRTDW